MTFEALGSAFGMGLLFLLGKSLDVSGLHFCGGGISDKVTCLTLSFRTVFELLANRRKHFPLEAEISS